MTREFRILFQYNSQYYKARVVRNSRGSRIDYAVRPKATSLVREYGKQTLIFKENGMFSCDSQVNLNTPEYVNALVNAIKEQDIAKEGNQPMQ